MKGKHKPRQTSYKEKNHQQKYNTHFPVRITHDHESYEKNVYGDANARKQVFCHEDIAECTVRQHECQNNTNCEKAQDLKPVYFGDETLEIAQLHKFVHIVGFHFSRFDVGS